MGNLLFRNLLYINYILSTVKKLTLFKDGKSQRMQSKVVVGIKSDHFADTLTYFYVIFTAQIDSTNLSWGNNTTYNWTLDWNSTTNEATFSVTGAGKDLSHTYTGSYDKFNALLV